MATEKLFSDSKPGESLAHFAHAFLLVACHRFLFRVKEQTEEWLNNVYEYVIIPNRLDLLWAAGPSTLCFSRPPPQRGTHKESDRRRAPGNFLMRRCILFGRRPTPYNSESFDTSFRCLGPSRRCYFQESLHPANSVP